MEPKEIVMFQKTRFVILGIVLKYGEVCICDLESVPGLTQPTITHHPLRLYFQGLLKKREDCKFTYYRANEDNVLLIRKVLGLAVAQER